MPFEARSTLRVYYDILCGVHRLGKDGQTITFSGIARESLVPINRLKKRLSELRSLGLVGDNLSITSVGYAFCNDYVKYADQLLRKYGFRPDQ